MPGHNGSMVLAVLVLVLLLLVNAVLAMSELAVMTSRHSRLAQAAGRGDRGSAKALALARDPSRFLSTVQVGITIVGIFAGAFGEKSLSASLRASLEPLPWVGPWAGPVSLVIVVLALTYFTLVLGELVPKRIALAHPEAVARLIARPLDLLSRIAAIPVRILTFSTETVLGLFRVRVPPGHEVSEEDVKALLARAASTGVFDPQEHDLLKRLFRVRDLRVRDLMVPRADVIWIDQAWSVAEVRVLVGTSPHSHYPVCRAGLDHVEGVVHIKDLITYGLLEHAAFEIGSVARPPLYVPEATPVLRLLEAFQSQRTHVALVVDEYGAVEGLIALNDVLRVIVGDISRVGGEQPSRLTMLEDGTMLADGSLPLHEFVAGAGLPEESSRDFRGVSTVAGLLLALLSRVPSRGDLVEWRGLRLEVVEMDRQRVDRISVRRVRPPGGPPAPDDA